MRNKLDIYRANFASLKLSAQDSTVRLVKCVSNALNSDEYHQFYAEEVKALLETWMMSSIFCQRCFGVCGSVRLTSLGSHPTSELPLLECQ